MVLASGYLRSECQHGWVLVSAFLLGHRWLPSCLYTMWQGERVRNQALSCLLWGNSPIMRAPLSLLHYLVKVPPPNITLGIRALTCEFGGRHTHSIYSSGFWHPCPHFLWSSMSPRTPTSILHRLSPVIIFPSLFISSSFLIPNYGGHTFSLSRLNNFLSDHWVLLLAPETYFQRAILLQAGEELQRLY